MTSPTPRTPPVIPASGAEVHVVLLAGQSNMSGRAQPVPEGIPSPRVFQFGAHRRVIELASGLLDMHDVPTGMSYALIAACAYARLLPANSVVLLVPAAHGNTGFSTTTQEPPPAGCSTSEGGTWQVGATGSAISLYDHLLAQTTAALAAARTYFRAAPRVRALLWHQGESDSLNGMSEASYMAHLRALICGVRTHVGDPELPVLIGGMSPAWMRSVPASAAIHRAHHAIASSIPRASFVSGRAGAGRVDDEVHYGDKDIEDLGLRTANAWAAILGETDVHRRDTRRSA